MSTIHSTAIIGCDVTIGDNVTIGPYVVIDDHVRIGNGCVLESHVTIHSFVEMGQDNHIFSHADLGGLPQDIHFDTTTESWVKIGDRNTVREYSTIHRATDPSRNTIVGNDNYFMGYVHIAHDCKLANNIIIANFTPLAGFVEVEDRAFISGGASVHQFCRIGTMSIVAGGAVVNQDVLPYSLVQGNPAKLFGLNIVGMRRNDVSSETRLALKKVLEYITKRESLENTLHIITQEFAHIPEALHIAEFIRLSKRSFVD